MTTNVLISRHDKIGDFIVALPMFQCLKAARPEYRLIALVAKVNVSLARELDYIDAVIEYNPDDMAGTLAEIKKYNCQISISAFIDNQIGFLLWRAGIPVRIAPATKIAQIWFNRRIKQRRSRVEKTEYQYNLDLLKALDTSLETKLKFPLFNLDKSQCAKAVASFKAEHKLDNEKPIVVFHPGSGGSTDGNLTLPDYIRLAETVLEQGTCEVVFTFGPDDKDLLQKVSGCLQGRVVIYSSEGSIYDFALLLSGIKLFISTSTGPMHLAAGVNTHTISFFGDVTVASPARWASVNQPDYQHNFTVAEGYTEQVYKEIESVLLQQVSA